MRRRHWDAVVDRREIASPAQQTAACWAIQTAHLYNGTTHDEQCCIIIATYIHLTTSYCVGAGVSKCGGGAVRIVLLLKLAAGFGSDFGTGGS